MAFPYRHWMRWYGLPKLLPRLQTVFPPSPAALLLLSTAAVVGAVAGLGAILFRELTRWLAHLIFTIGKPVLTLPGMPSGILIPMLGGGVIGVLMYRHAQVAIGLGLDEVVESVALWGGRLTFLRMLKKAIAAAICLSTGGSVGREEPIAQFGSALASAIGQRLHLPEDRLRYVVASGAAGGMAVALHAPIAAVFFALEVVLAECSAVAVGSMVIAAVSACAIARMMGYQGPVISVPAFALISSRELLLYAGLGVLTALLSLVFVVIFCLVDVLFAAVDCPVDLKPMLGGLLTGCLGLYVPQIWGGGYDPLTEVLQSQLSPGLMVILMAAKILATSITIGSGGIGGVLAPSLLIGALLGGSFGHVAHHLWPALTAAPSAYGLVGMAAVLATVTGSPFTAVLLVFEYTADAHILMPLLLTTGVSLLVAQYAPGSPFATTLWPHHVRWRPNRADDRIPQIQVAQVMTTHVRTADTAPRPFPGPVQVVQIITTPVLIVPTTMALSALAHVFERQGLRAVLVVMDPHGTLHGLLNLSDFKQALMCDATDRPTAGDITSTTIATVYPDECVSVAVHCMARNDLWCLPVVDRSPPHRLLGVVYREDLNRVCSADGARTRYHIRNR